MSSNSELLDLADSAFCDRLRFAVQRSRSSGANTLTAVCRSARGAFPTLVVETLRELEPRAPALLQRTWADDEPGHVDSAPPAMPEPHPIDYEWRYTRSTADAVAAYAQALPGDIACVGTPTVFWRLLHSGINATLFDRNADVLQSVGSAPKHNIVQCDLLASSWAPPTVGAFGVVILDPPWYSDHTRLWIARALHLVRPGGRLLVTLFPELVRPSAHTERLELLELMESIGRVSTLPFPALYATPRFEKETLDALGFAGLGQWRSGDLLEVAINANPPAIGAGTPSESTWDRVQLGTQVVAVRRDVPKLGPSDSKAQPLKVSPVMRDGSYLLKSVSARDATRCDIYLWTSRNRALRADNGAPTLLPFLQCLERGESPRTAIDAAPHGDRRALEIVVAVIGW